MVCDFSSIFVNMPTYFTFSGPIAWGGGSDNNAGARKVLQQSDPEQLIDTGAIPSVR